MARNSVFVMCFAVCIYGIQRCNAADSEKASEVVVAILNAKPNVDDSRIEAAVPIRVSRAVRIDIVVEAPAPIKGLVPNLSVKAGVDEHGDEVQPNLILRVVRSSQVPVLSNVNGGAGEVLIDATERGRSIEGSRQRIVLSCEIRTSDEKRSEEVVKYIGELMRHASDTEKARLEKQKDAAKQRLGKVMVDNEVGEFTITAELRGAVALSSCTYVLESQPLRLEVENDGSFFEKLGQSQFQKKVAEDGPANEIVPSKSN